MLDTVRRLRSYSGLDSSAATPALDAFAARGTSFDLAIAPAPWTLPSHASFFTGRLPIELSTSLSDPLDDRYPTLAEFLAARGYLTAGFVGNLSFATRSSGLARGFAYYRDYDRSVGQIALSSSLGRAVLGAGWIRRTLGNHELANRRHARDVVSEFLAWHDGHRHRPFFAFLNLFDGHEPYFPEGRSGSSLWPGARWTNYEHVVGLEAGANAEVADKRSLTADQAAIHEQAYLRAAATAASEAAAMLGELERRGALDNTIVVIVSDHGEQTGQHRLFGHLNSLYLPAVHVPLAIVGPNVGRGVRVRHAVGLNDLPVTIAQLAGALDSPFPGRSLLDTTEANRVPVVSMLEGGYQKQAGYPIGQGREMFALTTTGHRYIRNADGSEELFDLRDGVAEASNRASARLRRYSRGPPAPIGFDYPLESAIASRWPGPANPWVRSKRKGRAANGPPFPLPAATGAYRRRRLVCFCCFSISAQISRTFFTLPTSGLTDGAAPPGLVGPPNE